MNRPKLLLADDSVTIRKVVELTFADEGIDVTTVANAESAMQQFVELHPHIVLVDVGLDGTSGYQICEMIKLDEATRDIPVLLLVGSFEPFDQDEAERVGADGFLTKPFHSIRDLVARVDDLLGRNVDPVAVTEPAQFADSLELLKDSENVADVAPETDDIENLYQSSFAETVEIDEFDTVEDLLDDAALDDEMIETSYPAGGDPVETGEDIFAEPAGDPPLEGEPATDEGPATEFDWSTDSIVSDSPEVEADPAKFEPKFVFEESQGSLDKLSERDEYEDPDISERSVGSLRSQDIEAETRLDHASVDTFPETPTSPTEEPLQASEASTVSMDLSEGVGSAADRITMSPEFITAVAQKVLESLSDRVVREVAKEAVPQIAEKLIREALDGDSDNGKV